MFGRVRRKSSNIRAMQLFHELKQQFPTLPDHVVSACIANHAHLASNDDVLRETLEDAVAQQEEPMGRTLPEASETALPPISTESGCKKSPPVTKHRNSPCNRTRSKNAVDPEIERSIRPEMNEGACDSNALNSSVRYSKQTDSVDTCVPETNVVEQHFGNSSFYVKRPNTLNLPGVGAADRSFSNIQPSGRCSDVHKLLNSEIANKPPRSPLSARRFGNLKNSPNAVRSPLASPEHNRRFSQESEDLLKQSKKTETKRETADTPTQTTDTLLGGGSVNLSLNVKCSLDLVQSPTKPKCTTSLQVTPQQPWYCDDVVSPRSYTSVNLTLRPPSSEPQPPIDITSKNSSLTYSTSSFDPQKGLQSRLQITVGPSGGGVSSMRTRPRSSYHPDSDMQDVAPSRVGSLPDLAGKNTHVERQQILLERLKIELRTEKVKLVAEQREVAALESHQNNSLVRMQNSNIEKQLQKDIKDLRAQCDQLTCEIDRYGVPLGETREFFYNNLYSAQRASTLGFPEQITPNPPVRPQEPRRQQPPRPNLEYDGPKWNCHLCTFQNHPLLDKCEQCEMPRILHGKKNESAPLPYATDRSRPFTTQFSNLASNTQHLAMPNVYANRQFSSPPAFERNFSNSSISNSPLGARTSLDSTRLQNANVPAALSNGVCNRFGSRNFIQRHLQ